MPPFEVKATSTHSRGDFDPDGQLMQRYEREFEATVYRALLRHRARLRLRSVIWFSWADLPTDAYSCSFCHKTGFFDNEGKAKPSWWALLDFTHGD